MTASESNQSSPFSALVVDAAEDFREELVHLLLRLGFNVLGATDSYDEASALLETNYCDLLITALDISESDDADSALSGGAALAYHVHNSGNGKNIFLTDGRESSDTLEAAAACDPIAWVARTGTTMTQRERFGLTTAVQQYLNELNRLRDRY